MKEVDSYGDMNLEELYDYKNRYIDIVKLGITYELNNTNDVRLSQNIKEQLGISLLYDELYDLYSKQSQIISLNANIEEKKNDMKQIEQDKKVNSFLQIIAILFSISAINGIVELLYEIEVQSVIVFPIGLAKLIWSIVIIGLILYYYQFISRKPKVKRNPPDDENFI